MAGYQSQCFKPVNTEQKLNVAEILMCVPQRFNNWCSLGWSSVQVIEEIEEMMQDSPDVEGHHNPSQSDLSMLSLDVQWSTSSPSYEESECARIKTNMISIYLLWYVINTMLPVVTSILSTCINDFIAQIYFCLWKYFSYKMFFILSFCKCVSNCINKYTPNSRPPVGNNGFYWFCLHFHVIYCKTRPPL